MKKCLILIIVSILFCTVQVQAWEFAVVADFVNQNHLNIESEKQAQEILASIKSKAPDFVLIPGDLIMGRWYITEANVHNKGNKVYQSWKGRFKRYDLKVYPAVGDHELGDLPAITNLLQGYLLPEYKRTYRRNFNLPKNGPEGYKELSYYFVHKNALFITVQTFDIQGWFVELSLSSIQLEWLENVLSSYQNKVDHIFVQGHLPVLEISNGKMSSQLAIKDGRNSHFWQIMKKYNVDMYFCGEYHISSMQKADNITQIVTNGFVGRTETSYVMISVENGLSYEIMEVK